MLTLGAHLWSATHGLRTNQRDTLNNFISQKQVDSLFKAHGKKCLKSISITAAELCEDTILLTDYFKNIKTSRRTVQQL